MNEQEHQLNFLHLKNEAIERKLKVAKMGLEAIISNNCDTLKIAEKTLDEINKINIPQSKEE